MPCLPFDFYARAAAADAATPCRAMLTYTEAVDVTILMPCDTLYASCHYFRR